MSFRLKKLIIQLDVVMGEDLGERPEEFTGKLKPLQGEESKFP